MKRANSTSDGEASITLKHGDSVVRIENGTISAVDLASDRKELPSKSDAFLLPGFIDIHNHGAVGVDVNTATVDGLVGVAEFLAKNGVTAWMPTLVPDSDENYARVVGEIDRLMEIQAVLPIAQAVGVHYEGVFANERMCGALRPDFFKSFTGKEGQAFRV